MHAYGAPKGPPSLGKPSEHTSIPRNNNHDGNVSVCVCVVCASVCLCVCTYIHICVYIHIYISKLCLVGAKTKISLNATTRRSPCGLGRGGVQKTPRPPQASAPEPPAPRPIHPGKQYQHRSRSGYLPGSGGTGAAREACTLPPRASGFVPPVYIHIYKWAGTAD